jgi:hypothetical protein
MRDISHKESAQILMEAMRIYHNYIKSHQGQNGKTPAEAANIGLNLNEQYCIEDRIIQSAANGEKEKNLEGYVIKQLGRRFGKLSIFNETIVSSSDKRH